MSTTRDFDSVSQTVKLDWSRLLVFDQVARQGSATSARTLVSDLGKLGAKVGVKAGAKFLRR